MRGLAAEKSVTQTQIADMLGIPQSAVSRRMRGTTPWSLDELAQLCEYFDVTFGLVIDVIPVDAS